MLAFWETLNSLIFTQSLRCKSETSSCTKTPMKCYTSLEWHFIEWSQTCYFISFVDIFSIKSISYHDSFGESPDGHFVYFFVFLFFLRLFWRDHDTTTGAAGSDQHEGRPRRGGRPRLRLGQRGGRRTDAVLRHRLGPPHRRHLPGQSGPHLPAFLQQTGTVTDLASNDSFSKPKWVL